MKLPSLPSFATAAIVGAALGATLAFYARSHGGPIGMGGGTGEPTGASRPDTGATYDTLLAKVRRGGLLDADASWIDSLAREGSDEKHRLLAISALGQIRSDVATQALEGIVRTAPEEASRLHAAHALQSSTSGGSAQALLNVAARDPSSSVRESAVHALAGMKRGRPEVSQGLTGFLTIEQDPRVRRSILTTLAKRDDGVEAVLSILAGSMSAEERAAAAAALQYAQDSHVAERLDALFAVEASGSVCERIDETRKTLRGELTLEGIHATSEGASPSNVGRDGK